MDGMISQFINIAQKILPIFIGTRDDWRLHRPVRPGTPTPSFSWVGPAAMIIVTLIGWFAFKDAISDERDEGGVAFALFIGSVSIVFMAWSNVLATRLSFLERFFGGLDHMYRWHRWFGALSVATMWYHIQTIDDVKGIPGASKSVADSAEDLAGTAETLLYILIVISLIRWIPYRWWKLSHKFLIIPFVFSSWHFHTATKPYANSDLWGRWFQALMIMGIVAWLYRVVWADIVVRGRRYTVESVKQSAGITSVQLRPLGRPITYRSGQFVFVKFGRFGNGEPHPFTIASHPSNKTLQLHIKNLGDWSGSLSEHIVAGDHVTVEGPYGGLQLFPQQTNTALWIAGGVGITPFLGAAQETSEHGVVPHLFYAVRTRDEAVGLDVLEQSHADGRIVLHLFVSQENGRLCIADIQRTFGPDGLAGAHVVMCGPNALIRDMTRVVRRLGARHVHVEGFDIRSGIGPDLSRDLDSAVTWLRNRRTKADVIS